MTVEDILKCENCGNDMELKDKKIDSDGAAWTWVKSEYYCNTCQKTYTREIQYPYDHEEM